MVAARSGGIEAVIAARRSELPTREELQQRLSDLTAHLRGPREGTPGDITTADAELALQSAGRMSMESFERALEAVTGDGDTPSTPEPTAREMAAEVAARLGIEAAPLTQLVQHASDILGFEPRAEGVTLIEQLRAVYDNVVADFSESPSPTAAPSGMSGSLLEGTYDETEASTSFAAAVAEFRGEAAPPTRERKKGPPLGERLLAKGLVSGCTT